MKFKLSKKEWESIGKQAGWSGTSGTVKTAASYDKKYLEQFRQSLTNGRIRSVKVNDLINPKTPAMNYIVTALNKHNWTGLCHGGNCAMSFGVLVKDFNKNHPEVPIENITIGTLIDFLDSNSDISRPKWFNNMLDILSMLADENSKISIDRKNAPATGAIYNSQKDELLSLQRDRQFGD